VFSIGFSAVSSVFLARFLGKERLGEYGALYAYLSLYGFFATFCLKQILAREVSQHPEKSAELFRTGTLTALGFAVAGTLIAPAIAPLFGTPELFAG
jgi:O-antigen/teichoic acid export membrane protein